MVASRGRALSIAPTPYHLALGSDPINAYAQILLVTKAVHMGERHEPSLGSNSLKKSCQAEARRHPRGLEARSRRPQPPASSGDSRSDREAGAHFRFLGSPVNAASPAGKLMMQMLGAFAEFESDIVIERTKAGLKSTRDRGRIGGNPRLKNGADRQAAVQII